MSSGRRKQIKIDLPAVDIPPPSDCPPNCDPGEIDQPVVVAKDPGTPALSRETIVYDIFTNSYSKIRDSIEARMGHFCSSSIHNGSEADPWDSASDTTRIFVFGGYAGNANMPTPLLRSCEQFDVTEGTWTNITDIPTPRAFGMTAKVGHHIYCIGGIELDPLLDKFVVSQKNERYNIHTGTWSSMAEMPTGYGVAYGDAQTDRTYIYVVCGFVEFENSTDPGTMNDKILRYSIADDEWTVITPVTTGTVAEKYNRVSPFGFYRTTTNEYYVCGGSLLKGRDDYDAELENKKALLIKQFRSFVKSSDFISTLSASEQDTYIMQEEERIQTNTRVSAYLYPLTGFRFTLGSEYSEEGEVKISIDNSLDDEWRILPSARDDGKAIYIENAGTVTDTVFFVGGSNQNTSVTLNKIEKISLLDGSYESLSPMDRGRIKFATVALGSDIYILGGQTSGHREGYIQVNIQQFPGVIKANGTQSNGFMVTLTNDAGELIPGDIRIAVRGNIRMDAIDSVMTGFFAKQATARIQSQLPVISNSAVQELSSAELSRLITEAQNSLVNPNSDEFQMNSAKKLSEQIYLFPILYSDTDILIQNGIGGFSLKPRSEDPLADIKKLASFIEQMVNDTLSDEDQRFLGDLTREELASLGDVLSAIQLPATVVDSGTQRTLYDIETTVTVVDEFFFGTSVSDYYESLLSETRTQLEAAIRKVYNGGQSTGTTTTTTEPQPTSFTRYSLTDDLFGYKTQDGQSTSSYSKLPLNVSFRDQLPSIRTTYFNNVDWVPQINKHLVETDSTINDAIDVLDVLDHQVPFGGSQLYNAMYEVSRTAGGSSFDDLKKMIYVVSDNSENLSIVSRDQAIDEVNSIDGEGKVPVVYTVFSTSEPLTIAAQLERTDRSDIEKIVKATGGQSTTLVSATFLSQILNLAIGGASGSLGYGYYRRTIVFEELTAITALTVNFYLPNNTIGVIRYRYSTDGYNFTDFSEKFEGGNYCGSDNICSRSIDVTDFFAKSIEFEVTLSTGFTQDADDDEIATGNPRLDSIVMDTSGEKEDFIYLNAEDVLTNVQQAAASIDGHTPSNAVIEVGIATSSSHEWDDFQSEARPALRECGKMFMLERSHDATSVVPDENLTTLDGWLWTTAYGPWDPSAVATLYQVDEDTELPIRSGFVMYPRQGQVYFDTRQPLTREFRLSIINDDVIRVGIRLKNRLHTDSIEVGGVGYIYSTNDDKPNDLVQIAPVADRLSITPEKPDAGDTFLGTYRYIDPNNDAENGSVINWYKNTIRLSELKDKVSWTDADLSQDHKLQAGDSITFSVQPSDGVDYGIEAFSAPVIIQSRAPSVTRPIHIVPTKNGSTVTRYDTGSTLILQYTYATDDIGSNSLESGSLVKWFVNGNLMKSGTYSSSDGSNAAILKLLPTESSSGVAHPLNAAIQVEVKPRNAAGFEGDIVASGIVTIVNTKPQIRNRTVVLSPTKPIHGKDDIVLQMPTIDDIDVDNRTQVTLEVEWYRSTDGLTYTKYPTPTTDPLTIGKSVLNAGDRWYVLATPYDYSDRGDQIKSNVVIVQ